ncbi:hypothetical protein M0812_22372 [Anaeramoeba flamelloides]|uniref:Protein-S-isoprenylcysteine O-methyltransferase n=1 Tax=Anaeramoeba flamelloides TaxID=1746091 RepID=A0AAV7YXF7_9EUKA|nr:hypothetical protein M0812_22372 [Anaeramoeba flamelloides]
MIFGIPLVLYYFVNPNYQIAPWIFPYVNYCMVVVCAVLSSYIYTKSITPVSDESNYSNPEEAWQSAQFYRNNCIIFYIGAYFYLVLSRWLCLGIKFTTNVKTLEIIIPVASSLNILSGVVLLISYISAGTESTSPDQTTKLFGGIYNYMRHPQGLSQLCMWYCASFILNSPLILIPAFFKTLYFVYESKLQESDLLKRFPIEYKKYQQAVPVIPFFKGFKRKDWNLKTTQTKKKK